MRDKRKAWLPVILATMALMSWAGLAWAEDDDTLDSLLEDMGKAYAQGYLAPLSTSFGINQNSGLFHTAKIPGTTLTFSVGVKAMATKLGDEDQTFSTVESVILNEDYGINPGDDGYGDTAQALMTGPTVFGNTDDSGSITVFYHGLPVFHEELTGLNGLFESEYSPLVMPQASVGGIMGLQATVRWLPEIEVQDGAKVKLWGIGVAASANYWLPTLPVDVMVGFFKQSLDVGEYVATDANSMYIAASKAFSMLTVYGGLSMESSSIDVTYVNADTGDDIAFSMDGVQENRMTMGATLNLGLILNAEIGMGELTTFTGGVLLGF